MTSWIGPEPEVSDILINSHTKKIVKKKRIISAKIDLPASAVPLPKKRLSTIVTELTHSIVRLAVLVLGWNERETPLTGSGLDQLMMFCILTTRIKISDIIAINITGLNTRSSKLERLRYLVIHLLPPGIL